MLAKDIPFAEGAVPLFGHMFSFGKDPDTFMQKCYQKYGEVFCIKLGKDNTNVIVNPHDIHELYANRNRAFSATESNRLIASKVFDTSLHAYDKTVEAQIDIMRKHLSKNNLHQYNLAMQNHLEKSIFSDPDSHWKDIDLFQFISELVFKAGSAALVSDSFATDDSYRDFKKFDDNIFYILGGIPKLFFRSAILARDRLINRFIENSKPLNDFQSERDKCFKDNQITDHDVAANNATIFWAANSNTVVIAFWVVLMLYHLPEVRQILLEELEEVLKLSDEVTEHGKPVFTLDMLARMVKMDSLIDEVLRHYSSILSRRIAVKDTVFESQSGQFRIKKGDYLAAFSRICNFSGDTFEDPLTFKWDRYLNKADGFFQGGKKIKSVQFAFGGGQNVCPGRWFSKNEFKIVIATLLRDFDFELCDSAIPEADQRRAGTGTLPPNRDVKARYRLKAS